MRHKLTKMSNAKAVPEGLKDQECEKGSRAKRPPIPYVPVVDPVQEVVNTTGTMTIKLPDKTIIQVSIWNTGTPEAFLVHVREALSACKRKGYFEQYDEAIKVLLKSDETIALYRTAIAQARDPSTPKRPLKKKKTPAKTTAQEAEVEEPAVPADEAAPATGTLMTMMAEQPKSDSLDQGLKRARLAKKAAERAKICNS